jgi:cytochrome c553
VRTSWRRFGRPIAWLAGFVVLAVIGGFLFAWSGLYSVAASRGHWPIAEWLLAFVMRNSVETHAIGIDVPSDIDSADRMVLGAGHFQGGCAYCHGAPGVRRNPISDMMLPEPPDLAGLAPTWKTRELFWIVKHGIKYTGMPAWPTQERDDEVWSVVAFLRALPTMDADAYRDLVGEAAAPSAPGVVATDRGAIVSCVRCHGDAEDAPESALVPILHGQSTEYLAAALQAFADGTRPSGIMGPLAASLSEADVADLTEYYASLDPPQPSGDEAGSAHGETIARQGQPAAGVPACLSCHGGNRLPLYPRLAGQNQAFLENRLHLLRQGKGGQTPRTAIMAPIAERLSEEMISAVTAFFASLPTEGAP